MRFQDALRVLRGDRSQAECAAKLGHAQTWWSYLEAGKREPNLADLTVLSQMGLSLDEGAWRVYGKPYAA